MGGSSRGRRSAPGGRARVAQCGSIVLVAALLLAACADGDGAGEGDAGPASDTAPTSATERPDTTADEPQPRPSPGCEVEEALGPVVEEERTLTVDGVDRRYLLSVPGGHDGSTPLPVVLSFHGLSEGAEVHTRMTRYSDLAEEEGFVAAFPHGTGAPVRWSTSLDDGNDDLAYFDAVLEQVSSELCIDEARVYATGLSNGAMFTSLLVCRRADVLAAAAPVAGITHHDGCEPSRPVPLVSFHGTEDLILLFNGGVNVSAIPGFGDPDAAPTTAPPIDLDGEGYPASVAAFADHNGCDPDPQDTELTDEVVHRTYRCPPGADVEFYIVIGGGHSWPSSEFSEAIGEIVGMTTFDIDATRDAWEFMSRFTNP